MTLRNLPTAGSSNSQTSEDQARGRPITPPTTHSSAAYSARLCHKRIPNCDEKGVVRGVEVVSTSSGAERENRRGVWPAYGRW